MNNIRKPGKFLSFLLDRLVPHHIGRSGLGDYIELYDGILREKGRVQAALWCWAQIIKLLPNFLSQSIYRSTSMFKNYLKIAFRGLINHKVFSAINIFGLSIGLACAIVITFYVLDEMGYDQYHENKDNIYRLNIDLYLTSGGDNSLWATSGILWGPLLKQDYPEIKEYVRFSRPQNGWTFTYEEREHNEDNIYLADASVFDVFSWTLLEGDPATALSEARTIVLTKTMAKKYFGDASPVGKTIQVNSNNRSGAGTLYLPSVPLRVTGVVDDIPRKSHFVPDALVSFTTYNASLGGDVTTGSGLARWYWRWRGYHTYLLLNEGVNPVAFEIKFDEFLEEIGVNNDTKPQGYGYDLFLQKITDIRYRMGLIWDPGTRTDRSSLSMFGIIAAFVLFIACTNFMNLSTARSVYRAREVGMRKVVGAIRPQLVMQFLGESIFLSFIALIFAGGLVSVILPKFYEYAGRELIVSSAEITSIVPWIILLTMLVGVFAGSYPAFFVSAFKPITIMRDKIRAGTRGAYLKKGLIVIQFSISILLIISTFTVFDQIAFMSNKRLGFNKEQVVVVPSITRSMQQNFTTIKSELMRHSNITGATASGSIMSREGPRDTYGEEGRLDKGGVLLREYRIEESFVNMFEMEIIAGRNFSKEFTNDYEGLTFGGRPVAGAGTSVIVNEAAVKKFGWVSPEEAVGKRIVRGLSSNDFTATIIGVVRDFHSVSLHDAIDPLMLQVWANYSFVSVRIKPENISESLKVIESTFGTVAPDFGFNYYFLDEDFTSRYQSEEKAAEIFGYVSSLAIVIACLGLFGLASFTTEARAKEIGIRKVLGSPISTIVRILSKEYVILVGIANILAWPFAYAAINKWLENFAYRIPVDWGVFVITGILALFIAIATVSFKTVRAARANPVDSLRNE